MTVLSRAWGLLDSVLARLVNGPGSVTQHDAIPLEERVYRLICIVLAVMCLVIMSPVHWLQMRPLSVSAGSAALGLLSLLLYLLSLRGRRYPTLFVLACIALVDLIYLPNGGWNGSIPYHLVAAVSLPLILVPGRRGWLLVALLLANHAGLLVLDYAYPELATPFPRPLDRLLDLSSGALYASLSLAIVLRAVLSRHAREHLLQQTMAARLAASERSYRDLVESANAVIFRANPDGSVRFCNRFAERIFGISRDEVTGRSLLGILAPLNDERASETTAAVRRMIELPDVDHQTETGHVGKDGETVWISWTSQAIYNDRLQIVGVLCIGVDISERKRAEERRQRMDQQLIQIQRLESVGHLAGGIAHDFNNHLTGIIANLALLKDIVAQSNEVRELVADMESASQQARGLTQQLLTFARGGAPVRTAVATESFVRSSLSLTLRGTSIRDTVDVAPDCWAIFADPGQLGQVLGSLLINAQQAMPNGGTIHIRAENAVLGAADVSTVTAGRYVRLTVKDSGTGIRKEHLPRIFDPYFTTKSVGSGLGLAVAFSVIRQHGGTISAESEVGHGACFTLLLPAANAPSQAEPAPSHRRKENGAARILVVDDEDMVRRAASRVLQRLGYAPICVSEGGAAIRAYEEARAQGQRFAAVIMDLTIPGGMGGKEAIRRLLEIDPQVKAIVSSGYSEDAVIANYRAYGFTGVVTKPYTALDIKEALEKVLASPPAA